MEKEDLRYPVGKFQKKESISAAERNVMIEGGLSRFRITYPS